MVGPACTSSPNSPGGARVSSSRTTISSAPGTEPTQGKELQPQGRDGRNYGGPAFPQRDQRLGREGGGFHHDRRPAGDCCEDLIQPVYRRQCQQRGDTVVRTLAKVGVHRCY